MRNLYYIPQSKKEKDPDSASEFRNKPLKQWIKKLPTANHGMTTRLFHDRIREMNGIEIPAEDRLEALENLYSTFAIIDEFLVSRVIGKSIPLSADEQKIGDLAEAINQNFLVGYVAVLEELSRSSVGWRFARQLPGVIGRLIHGLSRVLIIRYILRIPEPEWVWLDLHSLYQLAERKNKCDVKIKNSDQSSSTTIRCLYKQILLLRLLEPDGLTQKEILKIYNRLEEWCSHVSFTEGEASNSVNQWWIILDEDKPAISLFDPEQEDEKDLRVMSFDMKDFISVLQNLKNRADRTIGRFDLISVTDQALPESAAALLEYLIERAAGKVASREMVFEDKKPRLLSIGLKATHQQLNLPTNADEKIIGDWLVTVNDDYSLRCEFDQPGQLFLGSLVSLKRVDLESGRRVLGIVNKIWMRRLDGAVHFDIALLSPQVMAAGIQPLRAKKDLQIYQRVLLFFVDTGEGQQPRLILESQKLKGGNMVQLLTQNESVRVILENRRNVGPGYSLFECIPRADDQQEILPPKGYDFL